VDIFISVVGLYALRHSWFPRTAVQTTRALALRQQHYGRLLGDAALAARPDIPPVGPGAWGSAGGPVEQCRLDPADLGTHQLTEKR
jgi:hypothetical protein